MRYLKVNIDIRHVVTLDKPEQITGGELKKTDLEEFRKTYGQASHYGIRQYTSISKYRQRSFFEPWEIGPELGKFLQIGIDNYYNNIREGYINPDDGSIDSFNCKSAAKEPKDIRDNGIFAICWPIEIGDTGMMHRTKTERDRADLRSKTEGFLKDLMAALKKNQEYPIQKIEFGTLPLCTETRLRTFNRTNCCGNFIEEVIDPLEAIRQGIEEGICVKHLSFDQLQFSSTAQSYTGKFKTAKKWLCFPLSESEIAAKRQEETALFDSLLQSILKSKVTLGYLEGISLPNGLKINDDILGSLIAIMEKIPHQLKHLSLAGCQLYTRQKTGVREAILEPNVSQALLEQFVKTLCCCSKLEELDLSKNNLPDQIGSYILSGIAESNIDNLQLLKLHGDHSRGIPVRPWRSNFASTPTCWCLGGYAPIRQSSSCCFCYAGFLYGGYDEFILEERCFPSFMRCLRRVQHPCESPPRVLPLEKLEDGKGNYLEDETAEALVKVINKGSLEVLNIANNCIIENGFNNIIAGIRQSNVTVFDYENNQNCRVTDCCCAQYPFAMPLLSHTGLSAEQIYNANERLEENRLQEFVARTMINAMQHGKHLLLQNAHLLYQAQQEYAQATIDQQMVEEQNLNIIKGVNESRAAKNQSATFNVVGDNTTLQQGNTVDGNQVSGNKNAVQEGKDNDMTQQDVVTTTRNVKLE